MKGNTPFRLPIKKLSFVASMKIRLRIYRAMLTKKSERFFDELDWLFSLRRVAAVTIAFTILVSSGTFGVRSYAYNSSSVTPEHFLYDLKRNIEVAKLEDIEDAENRSSFYLDMSERRVAEADFLLGKQTTAMIPHAYAEDFEVDISEGNTVGDLLLESDNFRSLALEEVVNIEDTEKVEPFIQRAQARIKKQKFRLDTLKEKMETEENQEVLEKLQTVIVQSTEKLSALETEVKTARENGESLFIEFTPPRLKGKRENPRFERVRAIHSIQKIKQENPEKWKIERAKIKDLVKKGNIDELKRTEQKIQQFHEETRKEKYRKNLQKDLQEADIPEVEKQEIETLLEQGDFKELRKKIGPIHQKTQNERLLNNQKQNKGERKSEDFKQKIKKGIEKKQEQLEQRNRNKIEFQDNKKPTPRNKVQMNNKKERK